MANEGKRVGLVTGGVGDLGYASAAKMAAMGMDLALIDIKRNEERVAALEQAGASVLYLQADV